MFKVVITALILVASAPMALAQDLESDAGKLGYAIGYQFGEETRQWDVDIDIDAIIAAIRDASSEQDPRVPVEEMQQV